MSNKRKESLTPPPTPISSKASIRYSSHSPLNTLDLYKREIEPRAPSYYIIYIHGGAFRDPLETSLSIEPSLPSLFLNQRIAAVASVNYRLSPHPHHPTHPSTPDDPARNARWPDHINDVRDAVVWMREHGGMRGKEWIVAGHSVGGTMAMMLGMQVDIDGDKAGDWGRELMMEGLKGVISIEGIYDFAALRDAHEQWKEMYDTFITGAFGPEEQGGWENGNLTELMRTVEEEVDVVLVVHSKEDELVEFQQAERMAMVLESTKEERDGFGVLVEVKGKHHQVIKEGKVVGEVVGKAVQMLIDNGV